MVSIEVDVPYDVVSPYPHGVIQDRIGLSVPLYGFTELDNRANLGLSRVAVKP